MRATATRTYNPLPFQDLEPKRFEDLVRQLVYDFQSWRRLEATGRSGSDDGFDARALEIVEVADSAATNYREAEEGSDDTKPTAIDRLWLIQCKREKAIGPTKLAAYLEEISLSPDEKLYGIIFAAACDFSKKARDAFLVGCRTNGIAEALIWGKGELEDMLYATAKAEVMPSVDHQQHKGLNNRVENSRQPTRERERRMRDSSRLDMPSASIIGLRGDPVFPSWPTSPAGEELPEAPASPLHAVDTHKERL